MLEVLVCIFFATLWGLWFGIIIARYCLWKEEIDVGKSIKQLRANISKEMGNLPFEITRKRQAIGIICTQLDYLGDRGVNPKKITTSNNNAKQVEGTV